MNRQWNPSSDFEFSHPKGNQAAVSGCAASNKALATAAVAHHDKFGASYATKSDTNNITPLKPFTGFDTSVAIAGVEAPRLSPASRFRLGLVGAGSYIRSSDASDLQGGFVTGSSISSWTDVLPNIFNPIRRGPANGSSDEAIYTNKEDSDSDEEEWREFAKTEDEEVLICGGTSLNSFSVQNVDAQSEAIVGSLEELLQLLAREPNRLPPNGLRHLSLKAAEIPLWALSLLVGTHNEIDSSFSTVENLQDIQCLGGKIAAGSPASAASAILSYRVSQEDVLRVSQTESKRHSESLSIESLLVSLRERLLSLDLSSGALEPKYTPLSQQPAEIAPNFKLDEEIFDSRVPKGRALNSSIPLSETDDALFQSENTGLCAAVLLLRDALQPTRVRVPLNETEFNEKISSLHQHLIDRLLRLKREERNLEKHEFDEESDPPGNADEDPVTSKIHAIDEALGILDFSGEGEAPSFPSDDTFAEELEQFKRKLHKWMDVPALFRNLQALSLNDNPSLFLDSGVIASEGMGSISTVTEPNVSALDSLRSLLQLSGLTKRYSFDYSLYNKFVENSGNPRASSLHCDRYHQSQLATLLLDNCGLNNPTALRSIAEGLLENTSLKKLSISNNNLFQEDDEEAVQIFCQAISGHKTLEALFLNGNHMSASICRLLVEAIESSFESHRKVEDEGEHEGEEETSGKDPDFSEFFESLAPPQEEEPPLAPIDIADVTLEDEAPANEDPEFEKEEVEEVEENNDGTEDDTSEDPPKGRPPKPTTRAQPDYEDEDAQNEGSEHSNEVNGELSREEAWRAKAQSLVWVPKRAHLLFEESSKRRALCLEYNETLMQMKINENSSLLTASHSARARDEREWSRNKKGWTKLQILSLANNPIGDEGSVGIASLLRHTVSLSDEERAREADARERETAKSIQRLLKEKRAELLIKRREAKNLAAQGLLTANALDTARPVVPRLAVPQKKDIPIDEDEDETEAEEEESDHGKNEEEDGNNEEEDEEIVVNESDIAVPEFPPLTNTRPGIRSLQHLNLSGCNIGSKGLKLISDTLGSNCENLRTLNLSKNIFGFRKKKVTDADGEHVAREDDVLWVSQGVLALSNALSTNTGLVTLDLSYNKMYPSAIVELSKGLSKNRTLKHLNLKGNYVGFKSKEGVEESFAFQKLLSAFTDESNGPCSLETLILDQNHLGSTDHTVLFNEECATLLASLCHTTLDTLSLAGNDLRNEDLISFSNALYALAMDKKTGLALDGSVVAGGMGGRRSSITDLIDAELGETSSAAIESPVEHGETERPLNKANFGRVGLRSGASFCVNTSSTLRIFVLSDNPLLKDSVAGGCVSRVIQFCSRLHYLSIDGCLGFGDEGFSVLCQKISSHPALQIFTGRRIGISSLDPLTAVFQNGKTQLTAIDFGDNDILTDSLDKFSKTVCSLAVEALGAFKQSRESPLPRRGEAPPLQESDDDAEDDDDCPPPPFDPNEDDITPAQSMQRQASRIAVLASSQSPSNSAETTKRRPLLRYVSFWGRRGITNVLPAIESLVTNAILEDFSFAKSHESTSIVPKSGPLIPFYDPLLGKDPHITASVYNQIPTSSYFLHRSVFEGAYGRALSFLTKSYEIAKENDAPGQRDFISTELDSLKKEVLSFQSKLGFATFPESPLVKEYSSPLVNTIRNQITHSLVLETRLSFKKKVSLINSNEETPQYEEDEDGRRPVDERVLSIRRRQIHEQKKTLLENKIELLRNTKDSVSDITGDESEGDHDTISTTKFDRMLKQAERELENLKNQNHSNVVSKAVSAQPPKDVFTLSKEMSLTTGSLLSLLVPPSDMGTLSQETLDLHRRLRWLCLLNRLAMK